MNKDFLNHQLKHTRKIICFTLLTWPLQLIADEKKSEAVTSLLASLSEIWNYQLVRVDGNPITLGKIAISLVIIFAGVFVSKLIKVHLAKKVLRRFPMSDTASHLIENFTFYCLISFFSLFALKAAHIPLTIFNVIGGALAIGIGFGSQNLMNNFISGIILLFERPIKIGDYIEVDGIFGRVQDIGMRSTKVLSLGNKHLIVPNSKFLENRVDNWTHENHKIRSQVTVGVVYGAPVELVKELMIQAAQKPPRTLEGHPLVIFDDFGDNALMFKVYYYIKISDHMDEKTIASEVRFEIEKLFNENNIVIAFPQRDIHLYPAAPLDIRITKDSKPPSNAPLA